MGIAIPAIQEDGLFRSMGSKFSGGISGILLSIRNKCIACVVVSIVALLWLFQLDVAELMEGALDSGPMPRMPGPAKDFVRGSTNSRPFRPGGLDSSQSSERNLPDGALSGEWVSELLNGGLAQNIPPSFKKELDLGSLKVLAILYVLSYLHHH